MIITIEVQNHVCLYHIVASKYGMEADGAMSFPPAMAQSEAVRRVMVEVVETLREAEA